MESMDASADVVRSPEGEGTLKGVEPGSLLWAHQQIEEVKAALRDDPGRAYSVQFTAAAEMLREHDPVQFHSLRRLLKDKQVRLGEFDRLVDQRRRERVESRKRTERSRRHASPEPPTRSDKHRGRRAVGFKSGAIWPAPKGSSCSSPSVEVCRL